MGAEGRRDARLVLPLVWVQVVDDGELDGNLVLVSLYVREGVLESDDLEKVRELELRPELHVAADALDGRIVAEIAELGEGRAERALVAVKEVLVGDLDLVEGGEFLEDLEKLFRASLDAGDGARPGEAGGGARLRARVMHLGGEPDDLGLAVELVVAVVRIVEDAEVLVDAVEVLVLVPPLLVFLDILAADHALALLGSLDPVHGCGGLKGLLRGRLRFRDECLLSGGFLLALRVLLRAGGGDSLLLLVVNAVFLDLLGEGAFPGVLLGLDAAEASELLVRVLVLDGTYQGVQIHLVDRGDGGGPFLLLREDVDLGLDIAVEVDIFVDIESFGRVQGGELLGYIDLLLFLVGDAELFLLLVVLDTRLSASNGGKELVGLLDALKISGRKGLKN